MTAPDLTQPQGAPDQKARVLEWLLAEPGGLTQLQALEHLAVMRLAAVVYRLKVDDGLNITSELVEMKTRYGVAMVACYHLVPSRPAPEVHRTPTRTVTEAELVDAPRFHQGGIMPPGGPVLVGEVGCTTYARPGPCTVTRAGDVTRVSLRIPGTDVELGRARISGEKPNGPPIDLAAMRRDLFPD